MRTQTTIINNGTRTPGFKQKKDVESQTSSRKETSPQVSGSDTELLLENLTRSTPVQCFDDSKKQQLEIQRKETDLTTPDSGDDNISPPKITTSRIEEGLLRDNLPMNSTCHYPQQLSQHERKKCLWISRMA